MLDVDAAWDETCCGSHKGGNWWDKAHTQKATASNAGATIASIRLYSVTHDQRFLINAKKLYSFWANAMINTTTGQVCDHFTVPAGKQVWWPFTYNQGLMIGAAALLYQSTNSTQYLNDAMLYANFLISDLTEHVPGYGSILSDCVMCRCTQCSGDCPQFKGPAFRYLILLRDQLRAVTSSASTASNIHFGFNLHAMANSISDVLTASVNALWDRARDTASNLFNCDWGTSAPPDAMCWQSQQNTAVTAFSLFES